MPVLFRSRWLWSEKFENNHIVFAEQDTGILNAGQIVIVCIAQGPYGAECSECPAQHNGNRSLAFMVCDKLRAGKKVCK